jgi:hypothetical protein
MTTILLMPVQVEHLASGLKIKGPIVALGSDSQFVKKSEEKNLNGTTIYLLPTGIGKDIADVLGIDAKSATHCGIIKEVSDHAIKSERPASTRNDTPFKKYIRIEKLERLCKPIPLNLFSTDPGGKTPAIHLGPIRVTLGDCARQSS